MPIHLNQSEPVLTPTDSNAGSSVVGILLAAGKGKRFDPSGAQDKLAQKLPGGSTVAVTTAKNMLAALPRVVAVVRPDASELADQLSELGCDVTVCADAGKGMGHSLVHAIKASADAAVWVIGLADMPYTKPATITALLEAIRHGADIAVPVYQGKRGNPVAIGRLHRERLLALGGDEGARHLLKNFPVVEVEVDDAGIRQDIDLPGDLLSGLNTGH